MADASPLRMCDSCGGVDDHPRHVYGVVTGDGRVADDVAAKALENAGPEDFAEILRQIRDETTVMKHMDCCRADGCPDNVCDTVTDGAEDLRGDDLREHLTTRDE